MDQLSTFCILSQTKANKENQIVLLTSLLKGPDSLELLDDGGEGVGDDSDHDEQGEEEDEDRGHDELDVGAGHSSVLLQALFFAHSGQD